MKPTHSNIASCNGFTLIEVIATIIVVGILAAFFIHFMGTAMDSSWKSVELVAGEAKAEGTIEQIIADYVKEINLNPDDALANLVTNNADGTYGSNVSMVYIGFDVTGAEIPVAGTSELLKVICQAPGNNLTVILPKSRWNSTDPKIEY